jgi:hypothetical protein
MPNVRLIGRRQHTVFQPEGFRDAGAVGRIGAHAIGDMALLDMKFQTPVETIIDIGQRCICMI